MDINMNIMLIYLIGILHELKYWYHVFASETYVAIKCWHIRNYVELPVFLFREITIGLWKSRK